jgi:hypothetical protein
MTKTEIVTGSIQFDRACMDSSDSVPMSNTLKLHNYSIIKLDISLKS